MCFYRESVSLFIRVSLSPLGLLHTIEVCFYLSTFFWEEINLWIMFEIYTQWESLSFFPCCKHLNSVVVSFINNLNDFRITIKRKYNSEFGLLHHLANEQFYTNKNISLVPWLIHREKIFSDNPLNGSKLKTIPLKGTSFSSRVL